MTPFSSLLAPYLREMCCARSNQNSIFIHGVNTLNKKDISEDDSLLFLYIFNFLALFNLLFLVLIYIMNSIFF